MKYKTEMNKPEKDTEHLAISINGGIDRFRITERDGCLRVTKYSDDIQGDISLIPVCGNVILLK